MLVYVCTVNSEWLYNLGYLAFAWNVSQRTTQPYWSCNVYGIIARQGRLYLAHFSLPSSPCPSLSSHLPSSSYPPLILHPPPLFLSSSLPPPPPPPLPSLPLFPIYPTPPYSHIYMCIKLWRQGGTLSCSERWKDVGHSGWRPVLWKLVQTGWGKPVWCVTELPSLW